MITIKNSQFIPVIILEYILYILKVPYPVQTN